MTDHDVDVNVPTLHYGAGEGVEICPENCVHCFRGKKHYTI